MDTPQLRRKHSRVLGSGLILILVGLSLSCRAVERPATGLDISALGADESGDRRNECLKECRASYRSAVEAEFQRFQDERRACGDDRECLQEARERHHENLEALKERERECQSECYNEGAGQGGR